MDKHLALLAPRHLETRFLKLSVDRAPFLCQRLNIRILPSIGIVVDGKTKEFIKGEAGESILCSCPIGSGSSPVYPSFRV